jgi:F420 biosynthesis protein FbiB-like protein
VSAHEETRFELSEAGSRAGFELLQGRRSIRRFLPQPVPDELLESFIRAATWAPSAHNRQPWRFVVVKTPETRAHLADEMAAEFRNDLTKDGSDPQQADALADRSRRRIIDAPAAVVLCLDLNSLDVYPDTSRQQFEHLMGVQSVAMAGQNLLLAASADGLGGVWICAPLFAARTVQQALGLPPNWEPQGLVLLGYPARLPAPRERLPLAEVTRYC